MTDEESAEFAELRRLIGGFGPFKMRAADALADEVDVLVRRKVIDPRSPAADALLDYRNPPTTERSARIADLERMLEETRADRASLRRTVERLTKAAAANARPAGDDVAVAHRQRDIALQDLENARDVLARESWRLSEACSMLTPEQRAHVMRPVPHDISKNSDGSHTNDPTVLRRRQQDES